ncbi:tyrosine-type recombinase/integrase [Methylobacterium nodulans]|uniref:Integrase family protein n=1 Tax=Methylobacterium nodulans (strain LMG 21967 / CNCM I-2342 / ORS 2060) TaxID=460265 RepID=B8IQS5_METNO|nr:site-specific integrase [Methylobacterium nodulans]ACL62370.1 integrase family protein [Methylobacterium nodulans ORS 2060]
MPRRASSFKSRTSRASLPATDAPEWELIGPGIRLGYRSGRGTRGQGGTWLAASRLPDGKRVQVRLGRADDVAQADGSTVLTHEQAKEATRAWVRSLQAAPDAQPTLTVADALERYLEARTAEGMKAVYDARSRARTHILPKLGATRVSDLTLDKLRRWRDAMVHAPKRVRTGKLAKQVNTRPVDLSDPEALRRRRDTANRTLTLLKAALNWAYQHQLADNDRAWRLLKPFRDTGSARVRFLDAAEQQRLLNTCDGALRDLVATALMTGARFGELSRLMVRDFDRANGTVFIERSKNGRARHVPLTPGGVALFERLSAGRAPKALLLIRENGEGWGPATYQRSFKTALDRAKLESITLHELRHSYASAMVRNGAPLIVVAEALGHSGTRMAEKHYAHLAPSYVADTIRRTAPDLALPAGNVATLSA